VSKLINIGNVTIAAILWELFYRYRKFTIIYKGVSTFVNEHDIVTNRGLFAV